MGTTPLSQQQIDSFFNYHLVYKLQMLETLCKIGIDYPPR